MKLPAYKSLPGRKNYSFLLVLLIFSSCFQDTAQHYRDNLKPKQYRGVMIKKKIDSNDRMEPVYYLDDGTIQPFYNTRAYEGAEIGDTFIKNLGTIRTIVKKKNSTDSFVFYPCIQFTPVTD